jgi:hypothetical protein
VILVLLVLLLCHVDRCSSLIASGRGGRRPGTRRLSSTAFPAQQGGLFPPLCPTTPLSPLPKEYARLEKLSTDPGRVPGVKVQELKTKVLRQAPLHLVHNVDLTFPGLRLVHLDPPVFVIEDFLSAQECDRYVALAAASDKEEEEDTEEEAECPRAMKVGSPTFGQLGSLNAARTSTTWFLRYDAVREMVERNAALLKLLEGEERRRFEEPQLVRYEPGQQVSEALSE